jgi:hypothetical protein
VQVVGSRACQPRPLGDLRVGALPLAGGIEHAPEDLGPLAQDLGQQEEGLGVDNRADSPRHGVERVVPAGEDLAIGRRHLQVERLLGGAWGRVGQGKGECSIRGHCCPPLRGLPQGGGATGLGRGSCWELLTEGGQHLVPHARVTLAVVELARDGHHALPPATRCRQPQTARIDRSHRSDCTADTKACRLTLVRQRECRQPGGFSGCPGSPASRPHRTVGSLEAAVSSVLEGHLCAALVHS